MPADHEVHTSAVVVDKLDRRARYADVHARDEIAGVSATDPTILLKL